MKKLKINMYSIIKNMNNETYKILELFAKEIFEEKNIYERRMSMRIKIKKDGNVSNFMLNDTDVKVGDKDLKNVVSEINTKIGDLNTKTSKIGDLNNLSTINKGDMVSAVNEVNDKLESTNVSIGDLNSLSTTNKSDMVGAINEVNNSIKHIDTSYNSNLLINGDFKIWQRGTSFYLSSDVKKYFADRWYCISNNASLLTIQKDVQDIDSFKRECIKISIFGNTPNNSGFTLRQHLESQPNSLENKLTLSYMIKGVKGAIISTSISNIGNQKDTLTGDWQKIVAVIDIPTPPTSFFVDIFKNDNSLLDGDYYITNVKLEIGGKATPFEPRLYAEELALCQRYYELIQTTRCRNGSTTQDNAKLTLNFVFKVEKRIIPTVQIYPDNTTYSGTNMVRLESSQTTYKEVVAKYKSTSCVSMVDLVDSSGVENDVFFLGKLIADAEIY